MSLWYENQVKLLKNSHFLRGVPVEDLKEPKHVLPRHSSSALNQKGISKCPRWNHGFIIVLRRRRMYLYWCNQTRKPDKGIGILQKNVTFLFTSACWTNTSQWVFHFCFNSITSKCDHNVTNARSGKELPGPQVFWWWTEGDTDREMSEVCLVSLSSLKCTQGTPQKLCFITKISFLKMSLIYASLH
jgi:hypothetical protein